MASLNTHLVIIDPQNDFCDLPADCRPAGNAPSLPVAGAHADMLRIADLIEQAGQGITAISVTLDSHQRIDIAHPAFWHKGDGSAVAPFTQIRAEEMRSGLYAPILPGSASRVQAYLDALEASGRYIHMVWPVHCEIGSWGHNVHSAVRAAYNRWEEATLKTVAKIPKGTNPWTEHYSAIRAEVPDPADAATDTNWTYVNLLKQADRLYITGEAGSHCVRATTEHITEYIAPEKLVLVIDCMSAVPGFEAQQTQFIAAMQSRGVRTVSAEEAIAELKTNT